MEPNEVRHSPIARFIDAVEACGEQACEEAFEVSDDNSHATTPTGERHTGVVFDEHYLVVSDTINIIGDSDPSESGSSTSIEVNPDDSGDVIITIGS